MTEEQPYIGREKRYTGAEGAVRYSPRRCIHFAACVRGLPAVFDPERRPWIAPDNADADALAAVVPQCPTGALHLERLDGGPPEQPQPEPSIRVATDGPLYVRGDIRLQRADGTPIIADYRMALCRCGKSGNKPLCDGSHTDGFNDAGRLAQPAAPATAEAGQLTIRVGDRGPYQVAGPVTLRGADGQTEVCRDVALCRCGASQTKPFCDGSHRSVSPEIWT